jgi:hypothetical protein
MVILPNDITRYRQGRPSVAATRWSALDPEKSKRALVASVLNAGGNFP